MGWKHPQGAMGARDEEQEFREDGRQVKEP